MKKTIPFLLFLFITTLICNAQSNKLPIVKTNSAKVKIDVEAYSFEMDFPFSDTESEFIMFTNYRDPLNFGIYTEIDTLRKQIPLDSKFVFKLHKDSVSPVDIWVVNGIAEYNKLIFDNINSNSDIEFTYNQDIANPYLKTLRSEYPIDSLAARGRTDIEKVKEISAWVQSLWKHNGWNAAKELDALYILSEVKKGQEFRCVEYGIVTTACLNAIGLKARTVNLKLKEVETLTYSAGHVLLEVYLSDLDKWVMVDPQWGTICFLNNVPLNAVELQEAITQKKDVEVWAKHGVNQKEYQAWIYPYLYYISFWFDNREGVTKTDKNKIEGKSELMLVPRGAKNPTIFQRKYPIDKCLYTNSLSDFYRKP